MEPAGVDLLILHRSPRAWWLAQERHVPAYHERPGGQRLIARLLTAVAAEHGVALDELVGHRRHASLVRARDHAAALLRWSTSLSYPELGRVLGGRDHTTVIESVKRHERAINGEKPTGKG